MADIELQSKVSLPEVWNTDELLEAAKAVKGDVEVKIIGDRTITLEDGVSTQYIPATVEIIGATKEQEIAIADAITKYQYSKTEEEARTEKITEDRLAKDPAFEKLYSLIKELQARVAILETKKGD